MKRFWFSAASSMTLGEGDSQQGTEAPECQSTFAEKFCHVLDKETRTLSGSAFCCLSEQSRSEVPTPLGEGGTGGAVGFPAEPMLPPVPCTLGTGLPQILWWQSFMLG